MHSWLTLQQVFVCAETLGSSLRLVLATFLCRTLFEDDFPKQLHEATDKEQVLCLEPRILMLIGNRKERWPYIFVIVNYNEVYRRIQYPFISRIDSNLGEGCSISKKQISHFKHIQRLEHKHIFPTTLNHQPKPTITL